MPHLHTDPGDHDATVSFFIVRTDGPEPRLTYHLHLKVRKLMMFGGHIERNETPWAAVLRELVEESGYQPAQVQLLQPLIRMRQVTDAAAHPVPVMSSTACTSADPAHFHTDLLYALITDEEPAGAPEDGESTDIRLVTRSELDRIPDEDIVEMWREAGRFILDEILDAWEPVAMDAYPGTAPLV
ncbi:NUDIX domain-containing protein [Microbacterium oleivorans]|uniref:NUDIX domain-containing protein n=1 Tax=Microbacterium oleivorans TaxID=273677 RepID=A0A4R5YMQ7_9MICO|nr:NUDIX domain-containing protein [Microbacterium oleivorans]TDL45902.1 NUDIX domain-containing protein [Microbacterium oleivorans]